MWLAYRHLPPAHPSHLSEAHVISYQTVLLCALLACLQEYEQLLQQQAVDMAALQLMEERHLRELGLPIGAVVKIKAGLAAMRQQGQ